MRGGWRRRNARILRAPPKVIRTFRIHFDEARIINKNSRSSLGELDTSGMEGLKCSQQGTPEFVNSVTFHGTGGFAPENP